MSRIVVDASVAIKWIVTESDSAAALLLRPLAIVAPDLLMAECANILWKKVRRGELTEDEAKASASLLATLDIELVPTRGLLPMATAWAIELGHPAYDCFYLALAAELRVPFVTADLTLRRKVATLGSADRGVAVIGLADAAASLRGA